MTDVIQLLLLLGGLALVLPVALQSVGGWESAWAAYQANHGNAATFLPGREALGTYYWQWWDFAFTLIFGGVAWQVYFQRVLSSRNEDTAVRLSVIAGFVCMLAALPAIAIGIIANAADWSATGAPFPFEASSTLPFVVRYLTDPVVATIGLGAIAAAVMSSVDSSILSASSMAGWNLYKPLLRPDISAGQLEKVLKKCIWIIGIAATLLALQVSSIYELWFLCSDFVYCLLFPALVCALFDKKANTIGVAAGFGLSLILRFGGGDATLGIPAFLHYPTGELFPFRTLAMVSGLLTILLVSRATHRWDAPRQLSVVPEEG